MAIGSAMASAASTAAGRWEAAAAWAGGLTAAAARPAADFLVAVVVLVASPQVAVAGPVSSSCWCRRRFRRQGAPWGGQQGQHKLPHASMAIVQGLSYSSARVCARPVLRNRVYGTIRAWAELVSYRPLLVLMPSAA